MRSYLLLIYTLKISLKSLFCNSIWKLVINKLTLLRTFFMSLVSPQSFNPLIVNKKPSYNVHSSRSVYGPKLPLKTPTIPLYILSHSYITWWYAMFNNLVLSMKNSKVKSACREQPELGWDNYFKYLWMKWGSNHSWPLKICSTTALSIR